MTDQVGFLTDKPRKKPFKLHYVAGIFAGVFVVGRIGLALKASNADALPYQIGQMIGALLGALFLSWAAYWISLRSNLVGTIVFCVFVSLQNLAMLRHIPSSQPSAITKRLSEDMQADAQKSLDSLDSGEYVAAEPNAAQVMSRKFREAAASEKGDSRVVLECFSELFGSWNEPINEYSSAASAFLDMGGIDASTISAKKDIKDRIDAVTKVQTTNEVVRQLVRNAHITFRACLEKQRVSEDSKSRAEASFKADATILDALQIRTLEKEMADGLRSYLDLLEQTWGGWKFDTASSQVNFDDDAAAAKAEAIISSITETGEKQQKLQRAIFDRNARRGRGS